MRSTFYFLILTLTFFVVQRADVRGQGKIFRVWFVQDHKTVEAADEIFLKPAQFDIVVEFPEPASVLVHASLYPETYDLAVNGKPMKKLPGFATAVKSEDIFNVEEEIKIALTEADVWYYDSDSLHSFNDASESRSTGTITCKRIITKLHDADADKTTDVTGIHEPLNIVFISTQKSNGAGPAELHRVAVRVNWTD